MRCTFPLLLLLAPATLAAQSVAGHWDAAMNTPGGTVPFGLALTQTADTVQGTVERSAGNVPLFGTVARDTIVFSYTITYNDHPLTLTMTARVWPDSMVGMVDFAGQGSDQFWARRPKPAPGQH